MQIGLYWSLLAGFLLGFTVSTLWEWFYFRRHRKTLRDQRIRELEAMLADQENRDDAWRGGTARDTWQDFDYKSPGVFLETEADEDDVDDKPDTVPAVSASAVPAKQRSRREEIDPIVRSATAVSASPGSSPRLRSEPAAGRSTASESDVSDVLDIQAGTEPTPQATRYSQDYPDDLSKIKGIGEVYKQRLYAAGIFTWHQIAHSSQEVLRSATKAYPSSNVDEWPPQASALAAKHGREGVTYSGPVPDDLTRITGIGPVGAQTLFRAGICTYAELAATTEERLSRLFPIAVAGDEPDFNSWIAQAEQLQSSTSSR